MATAKKQKGIVLLSKEKLDCYSFAAPAVVSLPFPPNIIRSMDVVDRAGLLTYIHTFIQTNKLLPGPLTIIIHDSLLFEKLIPAVLKSVQPAPVSTGTPNPAPTAVTAPPVQPQPIVLSPQGKVVKPTAHEAAENEDEVIQQFIDSVPFDEVFVKTIKNPEGKLIMVANKDLVLAIKEAFEKDGFTVDTVYPITVFGKDSIPASGLTTQAAQVLLAKQETQHAQNMLEKPLEAQMGPVAMGMPQKDSEKKRLYLMIGVFILLIGVLVYFYMQMNAQNTNIPQKAPVTPRPTAQPEVMTPTPVVASSSAEVKQAVPITLSFSQRRASQSASVQSQLKGGGYINIIVQPAASQISTPLITFTTDVPEDIKKEVMTLILQLDSTTVVQENTGPTTQIIISY